MFTKFSSLPQEIQDQIWTFTLPGPRHFTATIATDGYHNYVYLGCRNLNPLPIALQVCYASCAAALRQGFFFEDASNKGIFFIPATDILYLGYGFVGLLQSIDPFGIPGLDRVLNLSFGPFNLEGEWEEYWRKVVKNLYTHMPNLKTLNHISPPVRSQSVGKPVLSPLPGDVRVDYFGPPSDALRDKPWTDWEISITNALKGSEHRPEICGWRLTWK